MNPNWLALQIENSAKLKLSALLRELPVESKTRKSSPGEEKIVIVCHGFTGSKEGSGQAVTMGEKLIDHGFSTILFDFAGCGESEGSWKDISLSGQIEDLKCIVSWCRARGFNKIVLTGRSFGGSTVIGYAARDKKISAVCTWAAVARLQLLFSPFINGKFEGDPDELITIAGEDGEVFLKRAFFQDLLKHDLFEYASAISPRSLLIIHGSADDSVPYEDADLIYRATLEPKELIILEGANHRFSDHTGQVWEAFFTWLDRL
ncbi:MAG: alpha/beta hydrolase [Dethiobacteria bacterium]